MDLLVAPRVVAVEGRVDLFFLVAGPVGVGVAVNQADELGLVVFALLGVHIEGDVIARTGRVAVAVSGDPQHVVPPNRVFVESGAGVYAPWP